MLHKLGMNDKLDLNDALNGGAADLNLTYTASTGSDTYLSVDAVTGVVTPLVPGLGIVVVTDASGDVVSREEIRVMAAAQAAFEASGLASLVHTSSVLAGANASGGGGGTVTGANSHLAANVVTGGVHFTWTGVPAGDADTPNAVLILETVTGAAAVVPVSSFPASGSYTLGNLAGGSHTFTISAFNNAPPYSQSTSAADTVTVSLPFDSTVVDNSITITFANPTNTPGYLHLAWNSTVSEARLYRFSVFTDQGVETILLDSYLDAGTTHFTEVSVPAGGTWATVQIKDVTPNASTTSFDHPTSPSWGTSLVVAPATGTVDYPVMKLPAVTAIGVVGGTGGIFRATYSQAVDALLSVDQFRLYLVKDGLVDQIIDITPNADGYHDFTNNSGAGTYGVRVRATNSTGRRADRFSPTITV